MAKFHNLLKLATISTLCFGFAIPTTAEDTEIYQLSSSATSVGRPKVLVIFDDSGSMGTMVTLQPEPYNNATTYAGSFVTGQVYWSDNGDPPDFGDDQYFLATSNRCAESITPLATVGIFQGKAQYWRASRDRWDDLRDGDHPDYVDCEADEIESNPSNPGSSPTQADGYPDSDTTYSTSGSNIDWGSDAYTFYTANYMNWVSNAGTTNRSRMAIAQEVVTTLIAGNPSVDFGLMAFNNNSNGSGFDGGRVVNRIITNTSDAERTNIINTVNALTANSWTPLCETTYEAYRYMTGLSVDYGLLQAGSDSPNRDTAAESGGDYISPAADCAYTYIILMTDGEPSHDTDANNAIEALTGNTCGNYTDWRGDNTKNCLPTIAEYMANTDLDGDSSNGNQFAITYTIGFTSNQTLLSDTAAMGKGQYFTADSATTLAQAFQTAITSILATNESFTSPAVAVDTFSRTESRNEVFFAMFEPNDTINWAGNIKRLNLVISGGNAVLNDANGVPAFDNSTGRIADTAQTVWSTTADGDSVGEGGVGALLAIRNPATRTVNTNTGTAGALQAFNSTNITAAAYPTLADDTALFNFFGVADQLALTNTINWALGFDVDDDDSDGSTVDPVEWVLADMLHSRPLVVNYGARGSFTIANPDQRLFVGTNGGFLHMFGIDDGAEDWAFFPKELAPILLQRKQDAVSTQHIYGIDSPPSVYLYDGGDGTIDSTAGDKAYIYFGLRRGGRILYGLNISNPDSPSFMWKIDNNTSGFSELGQTWSVPIVTTIPGYTYDHDGDGGTSTPEIPAPVLAFGAGFDTNKDTIGVVGTADSMGRGIFIVDAVTGALIWSISPAADSATNLQEAGLLHSVPATLTPIDSNGDGITDRFYFGDTGGNVWRVDLPGNTLPTSSQDTWRITKLASFNDGTLANDRRFFTSPDVVRTKGQVCSEVTSGSCTGTVGIANFDAVLIGTGDRTNPNATDVGNQFYMIRDLQLSPYNTVAPTATACTGGSTDFRCDLPLAASDFYDTTLNLIQNGTTSEVTTASAALRNAKGWFLDLSTTGEKALARAVTLYGSVFFTTFAPDSSLAVSCTPLSGQGRLYQVSLQDASAVRDFYNDGTLDRTISLGSLIPDTPAPHFGSDKRIRLLFPSGGGLLSGNPLDTGALMPQPYGIYWYRGEQ